jgi:hypothetical protein
MKRLIPCAAPLVLALTALPVHAQQPPVQTRTYDYEWLYFEVPQVTETTHDLEGRLFIEEVNGPSEARSRFEGAISFTNAEGGTDTLFSCGLSFPNLNFIQVGPFAQQATADIGPAELENCTVPAESITLECPYLGVQVRQANGHDSFTFTGTYRINAERSGTYTVTGQRGPIICNMRVGDILASGIPAWITRAKETRRGTDVSPTPLWWHEPVRWLDPAGLIPEP